MAIPVFGGMLVEPFSLFGVPTVYCAIAEFKTKMGFAVEKDVAPIAPIEPAQT